MKSWMPQLLSKLILIVILIVIGHSQAYAVKCPSGSTIAPAASQTMCVGGTANILTATNSEAGSGGNPTELYQWYYNTTNSNTIVGATLIVGATSSTYTPSSAVASIRYYFCVVYAADNSCGQANTDQSLASNVVQVTVNSSPTSTAGSDQTTANCVTSTLLAGNTPPAGTGLWSCITNCTGVVITTPTSPTSTVTGLTSGVATTLRWTVTNAGCTASDDVIITAASCVGGNDACGGAIAVSCGNNYNGNTSTASTDAGLPSCTSDPTAPGVWYLFTGDGSTVTASLCGSAYDTKINVYAGSNCAAISSCVTSNDDFCSLQSQVTFSTIVGTNYYILVNGYNSVTGAFSLAITCCTPTVPSCATSPLPANGATLSSCTSTLSWTAPASAGCNNAASYDVYFGTTNPPPFVTNTSSTSYSPTINPSTLYYWQIRPRNSSGPSTGCSIWSFTSITTTNPQYQLVDDATSTSPYTCVTLTPNTTSQRGCAWDANSTLNFTSSFQYEWTINLGSSDAGADGLAFVMQNDPQGRCECGTVGGALGAGGITNSVTVEVDTYLNYEDRDDFSTTFIGCAGSEDPDHLDIWFNGNINPDTDGNCNATGAGERPATPTAVRLQNSGSNYNIENGLDHKLRIAWNSGTGTLTATVLNNALTTTYGTISSTFNPMTVFGTNTPFFGFTGSTGGLSNTQTFCNPPIFLPVELSDYTINCESDLVNLNWTTASEINNDFFVIERSRDAVNFEQVGIVDGAGNSNTLETYSWIQDYPNDEAHYYQLRQVDFNGESKIMSIQSSNCSSFNGITIESLLQKNNNLTLQLNSASSGLFEIEIIDYSGKIISNTTKQLEKGSSTIELGHLEPALGIYFVKVSHQSISVIKKVGLF